LRDEGLAPGGACQAKEKTGNRKDADVLLLKRANVSITEHLRGPRSANATSVRIEADERERDQQNNGGNRDRSRWISKSKAFYIEASAALKK